MNHNETPRTDGLIMRDVCEHWPNRLGDMTELAHELERELAAARHDIEAYRAALGCSVPVGHDGKLSDGTTPVCGYCNSSLSKMFPITAEELERLRKLDLELREADST